jgi:hypothetical protein
MRMKKLPKELFERLVPPAGGWAKLRRRLIEDNNTYRSKHRWYRPVILAGSILSGAAVFLLFVLPMWRPGDVDHPRPDFLHTGIEDAVHPSLVALGLAPEPTTVVTVPLTERHRLAIEQVPLDTDEVVFYWVAAVDIPAPDF